MGFFCKRDLYFQGTRTERIHKQEYDFVALSLEFHRTLKIIARILREVVNRERLCGTNTVFSAGFRKDFFGCLGPLGSTDTIYLCLGCWMVL